MHAAAGISISRATRCAMMPDSSPGQRSLPTDTTLRKQSERALIEREERFRRLAEDAPDLLYRMSLPEGKYEYVSPASLTFTGYPPEEFYKKPGLLYELVHSSGKDAFGRHLELLMKGNNPSCIGIPDRPQERRCAMVVIKDNTCPGCCRSSRCCRRYCYGYHRPEKRTDCP